ncbi:response regulators consisting of a CheY-like receiver domain and a winged-helix DNA-binding domain [Ruminococcus sp. CAG:563]|nr:response regulators consisting of a CheY-like receiver domain and a winged-helix DNA-binding domain [Ruminococcus sp. CAG:563]
MSHSIYIADDERNIRDLIKSFLESDGYEVSAFETGDELKAAFDEKPADLVILDIMMPGTDGLTVCKQLREESGVPIIILTAKDSEYDYVHGITIGSDDYLTKPFRPTALLMRVRSLLRRMDMNEKSDHSSKASEEDTGIGDLTFSSSRNEILCSGKPIKLTRTELKMLSYMMKNPDKAYSRDELLEAIWGFDTKVETRVTDETLRRIRKQLSACESNVSVKTMWGFGYRIEVNGDKK